MKKELYKKEVLKEINNKIEIKDFNIEIEKNKKYDEDIEWIKQLEKGDKPREVEVIKGIKRKKIEEIKMEMTENFKK